jgi:hypothetical protein
VSASTFNLASRVNFVVLVAFHVVETFSGRKFVEQPDNFIYNNPIRVKDGVGIRLRICKLVLCSGDEALVVSHEPIWTDKAFLAEYE